MTRLLFLMLILLVDSTLICANDKIPRVPSEMQFAGVKLKITEAARKDIQKDVDALRTSPKYFNIKLDRVRLYFPIIERVLKENNVPEDFKYLALQESALISDAVSSADAVGFWQFKDFTGREVGLRIDRNIDERLNIVASTHGASKYFKRHNFFFKNWVYTLLAHMTGRGGAKKYVNEDKFGAKKMTIDRNTHWYIKRFLAHKIAFDGTYKGKHSEGLKLVEYTKGQGKSLDQIAKDFKVTGDELKRYNKWLKKGKVPSEKDYTVVIPITSKVPKGVIAKADTQSTAPKEQNEVKQVEVVEKKYPSIRKNLNTGRTIFIKINGIPSILAKSSDTPQSLAEKGNIRLSKFLKYNDINETDAVIEGEIYYLKSKKKKANIHYHTVVEGESLRDVSQKFGIKLTRLAKFNRMLIIDDISTGRVLWLREQRPKGVPVEYVRVAPPQSKDVIRNNSRKPKVEVKDKNPIVEDVSGSQKPIIDPVQEERKPTVKFAQIDEVVENEEINNDQVPAKKGKEHTVMKGETLYGIARKYGMAVADVMSQNNMRDPSLSIGQKLVIGTSQTEKSIEKEENRKNVVTFHVVVPGDTVYGISRKYNIGVDKLLQINQKNNFDLSIGEKLKVTE